MQLIPEGTLVTVPVPVPEVVTVSVYVVCAKVSAGKRTGIATNTTAARTGASALRTHLWPNKRDDVLNGPANIS